MTIEERIEIAASIARVEAVNGNHAASMLAVKRLEGALAEAVKALRYQTSHPGECDGPQGCHCKAPRAIEALAEIEKRLL